MAGAIRVRRVEREKMKAISHFVFLNERQTLIKIIYFDYSGFALWLKKLEESKFQLPKDDDD